MSAGSDIAAEIRAALIEAGEGVGDGAYIATLVRQTGARGTPHSVTPRGTPLVFDVVVLDEGFKETYGPGGGVLKVAHTLTVDATGPVPKIDDTVNLDGGEFDIVQVNPFSPLGVALYYTVELNR